MSLKNIMISTVTLLGIIFHWPQPCGEKENFTQLIPIDTEELNQPYKLVKNQNR